MIQDIILLVDDELTDIETMRGELEGAGYMVLTATTYKEAVEVFREHEGEIGLLLVDVSLPGQNGVELAMALLRRNAGLKVLFVSGHVGAEVIRFYGLPASDRHFLQKPFGRGVLAARVREVLQSAEPLRWARGDVDRPLGTDPDSL